MPLPEHWLTVVKVTKCVHEYGMEHGLVHYEDKGGERAECAVSW